MGTYRSSTPILCKPLHNFFYGCSSNKIFKSKFDHLIKTSPTGQVRDLVLEAVENVIPQDFMDERIGAAQREVWS